ncbi:3'-5' exonuclease [bacterium]|nr:MAG: 3'-5' exonuclease [bacterium]
MSDRRADTVIVLDFETTGLSPNHGDRAIEIGAVLIENGEIKDRFQRLMNPGFRINSFIEEYTGITNNMLKDAPSCTEVMSEFSDFIDGHNMVAHNAAFDSRFLGAELNRIKRGYTGTFACSMLTARRIYQDAPNHRLRSLIEYNKIPNDGVFHRALADSEMTAKLWLHMLNNIKEKYKLSDVTFPLMQQLAKKTKSSVHSFNGPLRL